MSASAHMRCDAAEQQPPQCHTWSQHTGHRPRPRLATMRAHPETINALRRRHGGRARHIDIHSRTHTTWVSQPTTRRACNRARLRSSPCRCWEEGLGGVLAQSSRREAFTHRGRLHVLTWLLERSHSRRAPTRPTPLRSPLPAAMQQGPCHAYGSARPTARLI